MNLMMTIWIILRSVFLHFAFCDVRAQWNNLFLCMRALLLKKKKNQLSDWLWFLGYLFFLFVSAAGQGAMIRGILDLFALLCYHLCLFFTRHSGMWQPDAHSPTELKSAGKGLKSKNTQCDKMPHGDIIPAVQSAEQVGKKLLKLLVLRLKNVMDAVQAMCCCCFFIVL